MTNETQATNPVEPVETGKQVLDYPGKPGGHRADDDGGSKGLRVIVDIYDYPGKPHKPRTPKDDDNDQEDSPRVRVSVEILDHGGKPPHTGGAISDAHPEFFDHGGKPGGGKHGG